MVAERRREKRSCEMAVTLAMRRNLGRKEEEAHETVVTENCCETVVVRPAASATVTVIVPDW